MKQLPVKSKLRQMIRDAKAGIALQGQDLTESLEFALSQIKDRPIIRFGHRPK